MKLIHQSIVAGALLGAFASTGFAQPAQPAPGTPPSPMAREHGRFDPARFEQRMAQRQAEFKQRLQITPAQEGAWNTWVSAMRPPAGWMEARRARKAELERLSTPERIDRMRTLRAERATQSDRRGDATKTFYATLSPYQKGVFDASMQRRGDHHGRHGRGRGRD